MKRFRYVVPILIAVGAVVGIMVVLNTDFAARPTLAQQPRLVWVFEAPRPGSVVGTPCVTSENIFLSAAHVVGPRRGGSVYSIDPITGKSKWAFDAVGTMLPSASSPLATGSKLYFGEGMHADFACRMRCIDSQSSRENWSVPANDHIEGGPVEANGRVVYSAGNDGLYAVNREAGDLAWHFQADVHIDSTPCVAGKRLFVGCGKSRRFQNYQVICLDVATGIPFWRTPVKLPAWGSPIVDRDRVFIGLGNGRLNESAQPPELPAGALVCLDMAGELLWSFPTGDAVFGRPAIVQDKVVFGTKDGNIYGLTLNGGEVYRVALDEPVVGGIAGDRLFVYAVSVHGRIICLEAETGKVLWRHELRRAGANPLVFATPVIANNRLYVAAEMVTGEVGIISLFCFELPPIRKSD